jgi:hypothetical protein
LRARERRHQPKRRGKTYPRQQERIALAKVLFAESSPDDALGRLEAKRELEVARLAGDPALDKLAGLIGKRLEEVALGPSVADRD